MQKINFNEKLEANETIFFILEIVKKTVLDFSRQP